MRQNPKQIKRKNGYCQMYCTNSEFFCKCLLKPKMKSATSTTLKGIENSLVLVSFDNKSNAVFNLILKTYNTRIS